ncbi:MAG: Hsp20/alpha crystallin family protein [archaeon]
MVTKKKVHSSSNKSNVPIISKRRSTNAFPSDSRSRNPRLDSLMNRFWDRDPFSGPVLFSPRPFERMGLVERDPDSDRFLGEPRSTFWENEKEVGLTIDVPGVDRKDIQLNISPAGIEIRAEKKNQKEEKHPHGYHMEHSLSRFYRSFPLPPNVNPSKAQAKYENGVLKITLPKHAEKKSHRRKRT